MEKTVVTKFINALSVEGECIARVVVAVVVDDYESFSHKTVVW